MKPGRRVELVEESLAARIESVLFVAGGPVSIAKIARTLDQSVERVRDALRRLEIELQSGTRLQFHGAEVQLVSAPEYHEDVQRFLGTEKPPPLSRAALETLTIIAYKQPLTRPEIEAIRGVNCDRAILTLLARDLIEEQGKRSSPGQPTLYGTNFAFLEYFGLPSLQALPPVPDADLHSASAASIGLRESDESGAK